MICTAHAEHRRNRNKLLMSCASLAMATAALAPQKAQAQAAGPTGAFRGSISSVTGTVNRNLTTNTSETITVSTPTATINWSPFDQQTGTATVIDFLPAGNTATFTSSSGVFDYTVLNRIVPVDPNRSIALNGNVVSTLQGTNTIGGNVWFYSPGGIVIGATAVFDVGGLLLTSADLPNGFTTDANGFSAFFSAPNSGSKIEIQNGAQINARDTYVALIAPRIEQGGNVRVNGSAAYVAGEQMTMTFNQGLFDISVNVGTDDPQGIVHSGTTGGPANSVAGDNHTIYMAAVPKNTALTMLLGGSIGFDAATASVDNGDIRLSAGWTPNSAGGFGQSNFNSASIDIGPATFTSSVTAIANSDITALADTGNITFGDGVTISAGNNAELGALNEHTLSVTGDANVNGSGFDGTGGNALIFANNGGIVDISGNASVTAAGTTFSGIAGTGGYAEISASAGSLSIGGTTVMNVGVGTSNPVEGPSEDSQGGNAVISATNGGSISLHDTPRP